MKFKGVSGVLEQHPAFQFKWNENEMRSIAIRFLRRPTLPSNRSISSQLSMLLTKIAPKVNMWGEKSHEPTHLCVPVKTQWKKSECFFWHIGCWFPSDSCLHMTNLLRSPSCYHMCAPCLTIAILRHANCTEHVPTSSLPFPSQNGQGWPSQKTTILWKLSV